MNHLPQIKIPATYMRGGTSKGVFFNLQNLPSQAQQPGTARDNLLLRVIGSPDPYGKHTDGMGGGTSSTSKVVIVSESKQKNHDVDYLFGQVSIDKALIDWSGNCGNLTAAVGAFAINNGLVNSSRIPENGHATVRIWQANIHKTIIAHIPIINGSVQEVGDFMLDGVTFPAAEVKIEFLNPTSDKEAMFPTGNLIDKLVVPEVGTFKTTMINAGIPTIFLDAEDIGYQGTELQHTINNDEKALAIFETIRAYGALKMGVIKHIDEAVNHQHTPKIAFIAKPADYVTSSGVQVNASDIDILVRALSMGKLHHAMMGTAAVAIGTAAAIPGTLINITMGAKKCSNICFGHPSGTLQVGAEVRQNGEEWIADKVIMSRSARVLMEGWVRVPNIMF